MARDVPAYLQPMLSLNGLSALDDDEDESAPHELTSAEISQMMSINDLMQGWRQCFCRVVTTIPGNHPRQSTQVPGWMDSP